jgi:hypothetical protein
MVVFWGEWEKYGRCFVSIFGFLSYMVDLIPIANFAGVMNYSPFTSEIYAKRDRERQAKGKGREDGKKLQ